MSSLVADPTPPPNSAEAIAARVRAGRITASAIIVVSFARLFLAVLAQTATAGVLHLRGVERPFVAAADWFTVHGTLVDLGSMVLLAVLLRREGLRLRDLFRARRGPSLGRTLLQVPLVLMLLGSVGFSTAAAVGMLAYGTPLPPPPVVPLPLWAGLYSVLVWPLLWGFVEEATYNGYAAPRALTLPHGRLLLAVVCLGWAAQHLALPLRFDVAFLALRFLLAVAVVAVALYLRTRNLLPLALAHWLIDAATGALTLAP